MILKELMRENLEVFTLTEGGRISEAASIMREQRIGSVVIVDESENVVGIITDRDIAMGLAFGAATADSFVSEVMSKSVQTINETMNLFEVSRFFRNTDVKRLPVINSEQRLVGIVSVDDVMSILAREMFDTCSSLEPKLGHIV